MIDLTHRFKFMTREYRDEKRVLRNPNGHIAMFVVLFLDDVYPDVGDSIPRKRAILTLFYPGNKTEADSRW